MDWNELGNRADLATLLEEITRVPFGVLTGEDRPAEYSASIRMSWASMRKTTRVEDEAYCLMGLFGVSLPTNYGEGKKVFTRLQYKIMQYDPDLSLFAFSKPIAQDHGAIFYPQEEVSHQCWRYLMAESPHEFKHDFQVGYIPFLGMSAKQRYPPPLDSTSTGPFDCVELPRVTVTSYGVKLRLPIHEADGITIAVILCEGSGQHLGLFLTRDSEGIDPNRLRYFAGCVLTQPSTGSGGFPARLADLGDDLYNLAFNGKPIEASWRTIYVVPTASDLDFQSSCTPNFIINCDPGSSFRVPRWLITQLTTLQFEVSQVQDIGDTMRAIKMFHPLTGIHIFISLGLCTEYCDHEPNKSESPQPWAKVFIVPFIDMHVFPHDCSKDHLDSKSWARCSKLFGDANRAVRLSFTPSKLTPETRLVHLELIGHGLRGDSSSSWGTIILSLTRRGRE
ncbi:hypothetical protein V8D89_012187 [Ganoderma adspersum]